MLVVYGIVNVKPLSFVRCFILKVKHSQEASMTVTMGDIIIMLDRVTAPPAATLLQPPTL